MRDFNLEAAILSFQNKSNSLDLTLNSTLSGAIVRSGVLRIKSFIPGRELKQGSKGGLLLGFGSSDQLYAHMKPSFSVEPPRRSLVLTRNKFHTK